MARRFPKVVVTVGTKKGLFVFASNKKRSRWQISGPFLKGADVNHATVDPRTGVMYATANDPWFGNRVSISHDLGETWHDSKVNPAFAADSPLKAVERLWRIEPGSPTETGVMYCSVGPAALFRSEDGGETWNEVSGLNNHPTRDRWVPGRPDCPFHCARLDQLKPHVGSNLGGRGLPHRRSRQLVAAVEQQLEEHLGQVRPQRGVTSRGRSVSTSPGACRRFWRPPVRSNALGHVPKRRRRRILDGDHRRAPVRFWLGNGGSSSRSRRCVCCAATGG